MCDVICNEAVPFRPYCAGVATRTRNVSEYMLVLALCLVVLVNKLKTLLEPGDQINEYNAYSSTVFSFAATVCQSPN